MEKVVKYWIFKTKWGYFGLTGSQGGLLQTFLPQSGKQDVKRQILKFFPGARPEKRLFSGVIKSVLGYFGGQKTDFSGIRVAFDGLSPFAVKALSACRGIECGDFINYSELAKQIGRPGAARAIGTVLAKNPLPLLIPCHRVIRSDGELGGFSAPGGVKTKMKLIELESKAVNNRLSQP